MSGFRVRERERKIWCSILYRCAVYFEEENIRTCNIERETNLCSSSSSLFFNGKREREKRRTLMRGNESEEKIPSLSFLSLFHSDTLFKVCVRSFIFPAATIRTLSLSPFPGLSFFPLSYFPLVFSPTFRAAVRPSSSTARPGLSHARTADGETAFSILIRPAAAADACLPCQATDCGSSI